MATIAAALVDATLPQLQTTGAYAAIDVTWFLGQTRLPLAGFGPDPNAIPVGVE